MVVESFKIKEQRLFNEIKQLKEDLEKANVALEHNNTVLIDTVSERNKMEQDYNTLSQLYHNTINELANIKPKYLNLKKLSLIDRIFNYKKHFNTKEDE